MGFSTLRTEELPASHSQWRTV